MCRESSKHSGILGGSGDSQRLGNCESFHIHQQACSAGDTLIDAVREGSKHNGLESKAPPRKLGRSAGVQGKPDS